MTEEEAITIALEFWFQKKRLPILRIIADYLEDEDEWTVLLTYGPESDNGVDPGFAVIIVDPMTKNPSFFGML